MNVSKIAEVVTDPSQPDAKKKSKIIEILANDEKVVETIHLIFEAERRQKSETIDEMNILLSKADVIIAEPDLNHDGFMQVEIKKFYEKNQVVGHCFKKNQ